MKIAAADLQMASSHARLEQREIRESFNFWIRRPEPAPQPPAPRPPQDQVSLSDAGRVAQAKELEEANDGLDPKLSLLKTMIEYLTGHKVKVADLRNLQAPGSDIPAPVPAAPKRDAAPPEESPGYGLEYDYRESVTEMETSAFSVRGTVRTADGKSIEFQLDLTMERFHHEESSVSLRAGEAVKKDPLVLSFNGSAATLSDQRFAFDIDADGNLDQINFPTGGSGFLVFDKNGDGKATDGSELFGPGSGDGFADLASYDGDGNGWIDANDPVFGRLGVWTKGAQGQDQYSSLSEKGVGALALAHLATPFDIKGSNQQLLGTVQASGVFLQENGAAGALQQIDLTSQTPADAGPEK